MIQNDLYSSFDESESDESVLMTIHSVKTLMINQLYLPKRYTSLQNLMIIVITTLDQHVIHLHFKPRISKFQSFNKDQELNDLLDTDTVYDSSTSFINQSNASQHFNPSQASRKRRELKMTYNHKQERNFVFSFQHPPLRINIHFHEI